MPRRITKNPSPNEESTLINTGTTTNKKMTQHPWLKTTSSAHLPISRNNPEPQLQSSGRHMQRPQPPRGLYQKPQSLWTVLPWQAFHSKNHGDFRHQKDHTITRSLDFPTPRNDPNEKKIPPSPIILPKSDTTLTRLHPDLQLQLKTLTKTSAIWRLKSRLQPTGRHRQDPNCQEDSN